MSITSRKRETGESLLAGSHCLRHLAGTANEAAFLCRKWRLHCLASIHSIDEGLACATIGQFGLIIGRWRLRLSLVLRAD